MEAGTGELDSLLRPARAGTRGDDGSHRVAFRWGRQQTGRSGAVCQTLSFTQLCSVFWGVGFEGQRLVKKLI